jgi:hypothetical protein
MSGSEFVPIRWRSIKSECDPRHAPGNKLTVFGRPVAQSHIRLTPGEAHGTGPTDNFKVDRWIAFVKGMQAIDEKPLGQHAADG